MLTPFETFIEKTNLAKTTDELVSVFLETVKLHGFDKMIFCLQSDHSHIGFEAGVGVIQNYPEDWMQYYFENGFETVDPVITYCQNQIETFTWEEIPRKLNLTSKQAKCLNLGIEAGLYNGICTPLWGPNQFAGVGLATSEKADATDGRYDLITAYCNHFYLAFQRINSRQKNEPHNIYLTPKEHEILTWAACGKTDDVISELLNMSAHTVDYHMRNIFRKLDANSRVLAVVKALSLGLVRP